MKEYFKLQYRMINRKIMDGNPSIVGYLVILFLLLVYVGMSVSLFHITTFAPYIYIIISLFFTSKLGEIKRNDFLKICFGSKRHRRIRMIENLILSLPFAMFLIYKYQFYPAILLNIIAVLMAFSNFKASYNITILTPFGKKPFEFTVGFRNTFFMFFIAYGLAIIAVTVDNFNLGIFSLMLIFFTVLSYYMKPENEYFVWSYSLTPIKFIFEKIRTAFLFTFYLCIPVLILMLVFFSDQVGVILLFTLLGYLYLAAIPLAKYSVYPDEIDIVRGVITTVCFIFPPMLLIVIPIFASQSLDKLKFFLK